MERETGKYSRKRAGLAMLIWGRPPKGVNRLGGAVSDRSTSNVIHIMPEATVAWVDPLPRSDRIALTKLPNGSHSLALDLLSLAAAQRARLNFASAKVIYRAARFCVTRVPSEEEATQLLNVIANIGSGSSIEIHEADSIMRMAESMTEYTHPDHPEQFSVQWPEDVPPPPLKRGCCFAAAAAALVGEADCERILGNLDEAAQLLSKLRFVDPHMQKHAAKEDAKERAKEAKKGLVSKAMAADTADSTLEGTVKDNPSSSDPCARDGYGEAPRALQAFYMELCCGIGGSESSFGKARIDVLLRCAEEMAHAPFCPEIVWRAMGPSCEQRPQISDEEHGDTLLAAESAGGATDADEGGLPLRWPVDNALSMTALAKTSHHEALMDVAVQCMWSRRPRDAVRALRRLEAVRGFWEWPLALALPESPDKDRALTAKAVAERASWLDAGGFMIDECYASYVAAAGVLEAAWRAEPLEAPPLHLWVHICWRLATFAEERVSDDVPLAASYLAPVCAALSEQYVVPKQMPSAADKHLLLRWNALNRRNEQLVKNDAGIEEAKPLMGLGAQLLLRRARMLIEGGALEPAARFNKELIRDLTAVAALVGFQKPRSSTTFDHLRPPTTTHDHQPPLLSLCAHPNPSPALPLLLLLESTPLPSRCCAILRSHVHPLMRACVLVSPPFSCPCSCSARKQTIRSGQWRWSFSWDCMPSTQSTTRALRMRILCSTEWATARRARQ